MAQLKVHYLLVWNFIIKPFQDKTIMNPQNITSQHKKSEPQHSSKKKDFLNEQTAMPFIQAQKSGAGSFF